LITFSPTPSTSSFLDHQARGDRELPRTPGPGRRIASRPFPPEACRSATERRGAITSRHGQKKKALQKTSERAHSPPGLEARLYHERRGDTSLATSPLRITLERIGGASPAPRARDVSPLGPRVGCERPDRQA